MEIRGDLLTDRGLQFMLGQIVSNAIKYSSDSPMLTICSLSNNAISSITGRDWIIKVFN